MWNTQMLQWWTSFNYLNKQTYLRAIHFSFWSFPRDVLMHRPLLKTSSCSHYLHPFPGWEVTLTYCSAVRKGSMEHGFGTSLLYLRCFMNTLYFKTVPGFVCVSTLLLCNFSVSSKSSHNSISLATPWPLTIFPYLFCAHGFEILVSCPTKSWPSHWIWYLVAYGIYPWVLYRQFRINVSLF